MDTAQPEPPDEFKRAYGEGYRLFKEQKYDAATELFAQAAAIWPDNFMPWEMTGCCHGSAGRWAECVAAFEQSRQRGHECEFCWYNTATALRHLLRADDALHALDRALTLNPNHANAWYDRGLILGMAFGRRKDELEFMDGRHEKAVVAFDRAIALRPDAWATWYYKAYVLYKISQSSEATQGLVAAGYPPNPARQALTCVEKALALQPEQADAMELRDDVLEWLGEATPPNAED